MSVIDVVGGVYSERCAFPVWDQVFGSGGRAAVALTLGEQAVRLHTIISKSMEPRVRANFEQYGVEISATAGNQSIGFEYLHPLADPIIHPAAHSIYDHGAFNVEADKIVQFGMMEATPQTRSEMCVYDPQSPIRPKGFGSTGSVAKRLAFIANAGEAKQLTGLDAMGAGKRILEDEGAEIVIIKNGVHGATLFEHNQDPLTVPAYEARNVFTIGSGDIFVAAFAQAWMLEALSPKEACEYASRATSAYVDTCALPMIDRKTATQQARIPVTLMGGRVYLAGPFRETGQRFLIDDARLRLQALGMEVFSPVHDIGHGPAEQVVALDLQALDDCDAVFAILNGTTPGTLFEVGYARAQGKPVICVAQNMRDVDLKLPTGSGCIICPDYVTALHKMAWRR